MPKYQRGAEPIARFIGSEPVLRKYIGEQLVWDGTRSVAAQAGRAHASAAVLPGVASAAATATAIAATANAVAGTATATASADGQVVPATATAAVLSAVPHADAAATATAATASAVAYGATAEISADVNVNALAATATAAVLTAAASTDAAAVATPATAGTIVYDAVGQGSVAAAATPATASAAVNGAQGSAGATATASAATAQAAVTSSAASTSSTVAATAATASAAVSAATAAVINAFVDDFNRTAGTALGASWTENGGDLGIASPGVLAVQGTSNSRRCAIWNTATQTFAQTVEFTIATTPSNALSSGAVLRCNSGMTQMVILSTSSTQWALGSITGINGTYAPIGSFSTTLAAGDVIRVLVDQDNVYRVYVNGVKSGPSLTNSTYADSSHQYLGLWVQRTGSGTGISHSLDNFKAYDTPALVSVASDNFNRASLGANWTQASQNGGALYIAGSTELSAVGLPSSPISVIYHNTVLPSDSQVVRARVKWNSRNPEHSSMSVGLRADPASGHHGVHFWWTATLMGICIYTTDLTNFVAATGTADYVSTSKFAENALVELRAEGTVYTAMVNGSQVLQGTFTTVQAPLTNHVASIHGEDDSAVSGGGEPGGNVDDWASYVVPAAA
ncbi:hypothetical protein [Nocardia sp. N2S4-5]|uniref:hypothetical protein n=1 Tax=Nocardia sp. N2S4-5 TaxID=3351565 RepID=UPI0037D68337